VLLQPPTPFFPLPSPLSLSLLSGCVRRSGRSGGTAAPTIIRDGPDDRMTKVSAAASAAMEATEEEEYKRCNGADLDATWSTPSSA